MTKLGRRWSFGSSFLFLFLFFFSAEGFTQDPSLFKYESTREPVRIRADSISYDDSSKTYLAEGKVEILQADRKLTADRILLNAQTQEVEATGNVLLVRGDDFFRSERMKFELDTNLGIIVQGTLFLKKQNYYLRGEEIERVGEDTYRVRGGSFTTCDGDFPDWRLTGEEALVTLEEYADVWGATFQVKKVPILYSPYLFFPVKAKRQSGFLSPRINYSNIAGAELGLDYFWAIEKNMDATFTLDLATKKGIGEGLEYRYVRKPESAGSLSAYHIREGSEYREKYTDMLDRGPNRWQVTFQHEEYFDPTFYAKTFLRGLSDREFPTDYALSYRDRAREQNYSFLSLTKNWERFSFFGEARKTEDLRQEDKTTLQYYPLTYLVGLRQPFPGTPLFFGFESSYDYFWRQQGTTGYRVDLFPRISLPLKLGGVEWNTELGGRETWYPGIDGTSESRSRELWDFQTSLGADFYRVYDTGIQSVPKLKHVIRPEISYVYAPDVDQTNIPYFDRTVPKTNAIFYGFTSRLIGKVLEGNTSRYHEYVYLKLGQNYNIFENTRDAGPGSEPRRPFGPIAGELRVQGLKYVKVENITTYDPNENEFLSSYTNLRLNDERGDGLSLEYVWQNGVQDQINGSLLIRLFSFLDFSYGRRYSFYDKQLLETTYGLLFRQQCWSLNVTYREKPSISGAPAEKKFWFMVNLLGLTSAGAR